MTDTPIDFAALQRERKAVGPEELVLLGGRCDAPELAEWLVKCTLTTLPWQLSEWVHELTLTTTTLPPAHPELLERLRIFGPGGDLELRRDGDVFHWRFVGASDVSLPANHGGCDFWQSRPQLGQLFRIERQALLWGAWDEQLQRWYDDRVGFARLTYPAALQGSTRVYAQYREYLAGGQPAFVWIHTLSSAP